MDKHRRYDIVVVGELNADLILSGDVQPIFGQVEKLIDDAALSVGSSSAIFACGAARLGLSVAFIGKIGEDEFGRFMLREMNERGIDTTGVVIDKEIKTGLSVILSQGSDRAILTYPGSIPLLRLQEVDQDILSQGRHLHLGGYFMLDRLRPEVPALFRSAHLAGLTVSMDTNYDPIEKWDGGLSHALGEVDLFLPNEVEACAVASAIASAIASAKARTSDIKQALEILARRVPTVAVKLGERGAIAKTGTEIALASPLPVNVVDTTGAGDSFDAGFIYGYLNEWDLERSLRLACICGSLSTRQAGGIAAQPKIEEAVSFL